MLAGGQAVARGGCGCGCGESREGSREGEGEGVMTGDGGKDGWLDGWGDRCRSTDDGWLLCGCGWAVCLSVWLARGVALLLPCASACFDQTQQRRSTCVLACQPQRRKGRKGRKGRKKACLRWCAWISSRPLHSTAQRQGSPITSIADRNRKQL